jgi:hypothetical protein
VSAADPSSTTTGPQPSRSAPTTTTATGPAVTSPAPTTTSTTTSTTIPATDPGTAAPPPGPYCGVPVTPASEPAIVWGGSNGDYNGWQQFNDGAAYNPATGMWRVLPPAPLKGPTFPAMVWTGREMVIVGGGTLDGAAYDPVSDTWAPTPIGQNITLMGPRPPSLWTGAQLLLNGVIDESTAKTTWFAFDPDTGSWRTVPQPSYAVQNQWRIAGRSPFAGRADHTAVWTGTQMLIWGGQGDKLAYGDGGAFRPA